MTFPTLHDDLVRRVSDLEDLVREQQKRIDELANAVQRYTANVTHNGDQIERILDLVQQLAIRAGIR